jgi:hypothetical protein
MSEQYQIFKPLSLVGVPLEKAEQQETLLRFPGPCGFSDLAKGSMEKLAPAETRFVHFFKNHLAEYNKGIQSFGVFAVFSPFKFGTVKVVEHEVLSNLGFSDDQAGSIFLGANRPVNEDEYFWMPPEQFSSQDDWTGFRSADALKKNFGPQYTLRLSMLKQSVLKYMEEVQSLEDTLKKSSKTSLSKPWYHYSQEERVNLISENGIKAGWTHA